MRPLQCFRGERRFYAALVIVPLFCCSMAWGGTFDICQCSGSPDSLGEFRTSIEGTYPPGTTRNGSSITIPVPQGGLLIFDSFVTDGPPGSLNGSTVIRFTPSASNDPVRLLVAGDVTIHSSAILELSGSSGTHGSTGDPRGGRGGPGGFRGGDGAYELSNLTRSGGPGLGPGGGAPGDPTSFPATSGHDGSFVGNLELVPLLGGSGGGGGSTGSESEAGGGGGGGGGALLIAANGTMTIDGAIQSYGGNGAGGTGNTGGVGGRGSGGAIRLVANVIEGSGNVTSSPCEEGCIRMETALDNTFPVNRSSPIAKRFNVTSPVLETNTPRLFISSVGGESVSLVNGEPIAELPQGVFGQVDVIVDGANPVTVELSSDGLAGGTSVEVRAKPRVGGEAIVETTTLGDCSGEGVCTAEVSLDLEPGQYFVEALVLFR